MDALSFAVGCKRKALCLAMWAVPLALCSRASADRYWINDATAGSWSNAADWDAASAMGSGGAGVPGSSDNVYLQNTTSGSFTVALDQSGTISTLQIGDTGGGTDTLSQTSSFNLSMQNELVGSWMAGVGVHNQSAGTNTYFGDLIVGSGIGSVGTYSLSGTGAIDITGTGTGAVGMFVGDDGSGTFSQSGGSVALENPNGENLYIGYRNGIPGTYLLSAGSLSVSGAEYLGSRATGIGTFNQSGGIATVQTLIVSYSGTGNYVLSGTGSLNVTGSEQINSAGSFHQSGGVQTIGSYLAVYPGGAYSLSGTGSLTAPNESVGVDPGGTGTFNQSGGENNTPILGIGAAGSGGGAAVYSMSGGTLTVGTLYVGPGGVFSLSGGTLNVQGTVFGRFGSLAFGTFTTTTNLALSGILAVDEDPASEKMATGNQSFVIIQATGTGVLSGAFSNIASGQVLTTTDGTASYLVTIDQGVDGYVELSDFQMVPEPGVVGVVGGVAAMGMLRRRRWVGHRGERG